MDFRIKIVDHAGDHAWVDATIINIKNVLDSEEIPDSRESCDYCKYVQKINNIS